MLSDLPVLTSLVSNALLKILSLDYFAAPRNSLHILSFKDKRVFEAVRPPGIRFYRIQQKTRLEDDLLVLHNRGTCHRVRRRTF